MRRMVSLLLAFCLAGGMSLSLGCGKENPESENPPDSLTGKTVDLLNDTKFEKGFGAGWMMGQLFSEPLKKGSVLDYRGVPSPYEIQLIPYGGIYTNELAVQKKEDDIYWQWEEGNHKNFTDTDGEYIADLFEHKLCINNKIIKNDETGLEYVQYNNWKLPDDSPLRDTRLVKRVSTDKNGTIRVYYDTSKEIRNVAYNNSPTFADDIWPHLLLLQDFKSDFDMAKFSSVKVRYKVKVLQADKIDNWPAGPSDIQGPAVPGSARPNICLQTGFILRSKANRGVVLFPGQNLYGAMSNYDVQMDLDQYGQGFYRKNLLDYGYETGGLALNDEFQMEFDLKELANEMIDAFHELKPELSTVGKDADDYWISQFGIGWENMGNWVGEFEFGDVSIVATYR